LWFSKIDAYNTAADKQQRNRCDQMYLEMLPIDHRLSRSEFYLFRTAQSIAVLRYHSNRQ